MELADPGVVWLPLRRSDSFRSDLRIHSKVSDGSMEPREILRPAYERGFGAVAVTGHGTNAAHKTLKANGEPFPVAVIPVVELDAKFRGIIVEIPVCGHGVGEGSLEKMLHEITAGRKGRAEFLRIKENCRLAG